jgi:hypothetical protein
MIAQPGGPVRNSIDMQGPSSMLHKMISFPMSLTFKVPLWLDASKNHTFACSAADTSDCRNIPCCSNKDLIIAAKLTPHR